MSRQNDKDQNIYLKDVMRASWFARLALGNYSVAPLMPEKDTATDPKFRQRVIDLCS